MAVKERLSHHFVDSTRVSRAFYNVDTGVIEVEFVNGVHFKFRECSLRTWLNFCQTGSPGRFVHDILNAHPYEAA